VVDELTPLPEEVARAQGVRRGQRFRADGIADLTRGWATGAAHRRNRVAIVHRRHSSQGRIRCPEFEVSHVIAGAVDASVSIGGLAGGIGRRDAGGIYVDIRRNSIHQDLSRIHCRLASHRHARQEQKRCKPTHVLCLITFHGLLSGEASTCILKIALAWKID
jgi:hypothetical protein